jgi:hypothetical protein
MRETGEMKVVKISSSQKDSYCPHPRATIALILLLVLGLASMARAQDRFLGTLPASEYLKGLGWPNVHAGTTLYIADSEASTAREADVDPQGQLETIEVTGLFEDVDALGDEARSGGPEDEAFRGEEVWLEPQRVSAGAGKVVLEVRLPEGYKANYLVPFLIAWRSEGAHVVVDPEHASRSIESPDFPLRLEFPAHFSDGEAVLTGDLTIYYCREGADAVCLIERVRLRLAITVEREGTSALSVAYQASELEP